jgi:protein SCO1
MSPMPRIRRITDFFWWWLPVCAIVLLVVLVLFAAPSTNSVVKPTDLAGLRATDGQVLDQNSFADQYRVVSFGFLSCPDICPVTLQALQLAQRQVPSEAAPIKVVPLFISLDPQRDSAAKIAKYTAAFSKEIHGFTAEPAVLRRVAESHSIKFKSYEIPGGYTIDHTAALTVVAPDARVIAQIPTNQSAKAIADSLSQVLQNHANSGN